ncbi:MAG: hypothetical protein QW403_01220 [Candidatus Aenigmatarchaeota archaeon]
MLQFEILIYTTFATSWIFLGITSVLIVFHLYKILKEHEDISMVSFLLNPRETFTDIKIAYFACLSVFLGFLFAIPSSHTYLTRNYLYYFFILFPLFGSTIFAFLMFLIALRWLRRFKRYA